MPFGFGADVAKASARAALRATTIARPCRSPVACGEWRTPARGGLRHTCAGGGQVPGMTHFSRSAAPQHTQRANTVTAPSQSDIAPGAT